MLDYLFVLQWKPIVPESTVDYPASFLRLIRETLSDEQDFEKFLTISQQPLRRSIRINHLKISVADFLTLTADYGWKLTPIPWCNEGFWIETPESDLPLGSYAEHLSGLFYIQEASSMLPVSALIADNLDPKSVMDMAAAPGSKTTQLAAHLNREGFILANEFSASRVKVLHANLLRCGVSQSAITHFDARVFGPALPETFDAILLDAPCSGEGVIRKDPQALRNWTLESTHEIVATQRDLIISAFHSLKPGGRLIYSTCTLNQLENHGVVNYLCQQFPDAVTIEPLDQLFNGAEKVATAEGFLHVFPQRFDSEGFFVASLRKTTSIPTPAKPTYKVGKFPFTPINRKASNEFRIAAQQVGIDWPDSLTLWQRDKEIWLFPKAITDLIGKIRFSRIGLRLAETHTRGVRWHHEAAVILGSQQTDCSFALTEAEAEEWYRGRDIYPERPMPKGELLVTWQGQILGLAKVVNNRLKNSYPRELVRDGRLFN